MSYKFFQNKDCEFFPCHPIDNLNCLWCFCPLYSMGKDCGGNYVYLDNGIKDCSNCVLPHNDYDYVIQKLIENNKKK